MTETLKEILKTELNPKLPDKTFEKLENIYNDLKTFEIPENDIIEYFKIIINELEEFYKD